MGKLETYYGIDSRSLLRLGGCDVVPGCEVTCIDDGKALGVVVAVSSTNYHDRAVTVLWTRQPVAMIYMTRAFKGFSTVTTHMTDMAVGIEKMKDALEMTFKVIKTRGK